MIQEQAQPGWTSPQAQQHANHSHFSTARSGFAAGEKPPPAPKTGFSDGRGVGVSRTGKVFHGAAALHGSTSIPKGPGFSMQVRREEAREKQYADRRRPQSARSGSRQGQASTHPSVVRPQSAHARGTARPHSARRVFDSNDTGRAARPQTAPTQRSSRPQSARSYGSGRPHNESYVSVRLHNELPVSTSVVSSQGRLPIGEESARTLYERWREVGGVPPSSKASPFALFSSPPLRQALLGEDAIRTEDQIYGPGAGGRRRPSSARDASGHRKSQGLVGCGDSSTWRPSTALPP